MSEQSTPKDRKGQHVVMLVSNPCDPDFRVTKEAESLVRGGYRVTVLCTWRAGSDLPRQVEINGVSYQRHFWDAAAVLRKALGRSGPAVAETQRASASPVNGPEAATSGSGGRSPIRQRLPSSLRKRVRRLLSKTYAYLAHWTYARTFAEPLRRLAPDIIHAHDGVTLPCAAKVAKDIGSRLVFDSHELETHRNPPLSPLRRAHVRFLERRYLPRADKVITVGERIADHLAREYPIERPTVILNAPPRDPGAVPEQWDVPDRQDIRQDAQLPEDAFLFAYTGNITINRGLEIGLQALAQLQDFAPEGHSRRYDIVAVGRCFEDQEQILRDLARAYGVAERFHILPPVAAARVPGYISTADASLIPILPVALSYEYAMPNKLFEAMLSGNPILGSNLTEMGEVIRAEALGLTYRPDDPADCSTQMKELVRRYAEFERNAERQVELADRYSWEAQEERLLSMYAGMPAPPV